MRFAMLVLSLCLVTACSRNPRPAEGPNTARTTVKVENQAYLDMTIYVLRGLERIRLGQVTGNTTQVLEIPRYIVTAPMGLRFIADPIGSPRTPVSQEISVSPGDQVTLTIPPM
ncbi:MAG TPA: hypothetical protein VFS05_12535 [Gemmatimonadaceae bacterium]|nr:hypothetical protein [Gemmatimonadaceae bacterium]